MLIMASQPLLPLQQSNVKDSRKISFIYHSLFSFSPSSKELKRWRAGKGLSLSKKTNFPKKYPAQSTAVQERKQKIAIDAARSLSKIPFILFVGVTGSLAMNNAKPESDIDLMIITMHNTLWISRVLAVLYLHFSGVKLRSPKSQDEKDKVCLNLWIDETKLSWHYPKNAYIAHEIAQTVPLLNKNGIYERWLSLNKWVENYWPYAVSVKSTKFTKKENSIFSLLLGAVNLAFYIPQRLYMSGKQTRETVNLHEAFFHPYDWGAHIMKELGKKGVVEVE